MKRAVCSLLLLLLSALPAAAGAAVSASVDRDRVTLSESFHLEIRADGSLSGADPDLAPLAQDFEVLGTNRSASFTIGSGGNESSTSWQIELMAKREGRLTIPPIDVGGERTDPIQVTVSADPQPAAGAPRDIELEVETAADEVHVQQQLLLTVRVLHAVNLNRGATLEPPVIDDAVMRELGEKSFEKIVGGRRFGVFERRYAVFPQKSGELLIPAIGFQATVGGGASWFGQFGDRARLVRLRSEPKRVRVLPPEQGAAPWLPARVLTVIETWDRSPQELRVGDSATRTVTITAQGLTGAQLPPLAAPAVPGLRFYTDQPRIEDAQDADGITGTRIESSAVIPERAGEIEFPELTLRWWDTENARFEEAMVPRRTIRVLPAANAAAAPPASPADAAAAPDADAAATPEAAAAPQAPAPFEFPAAPPASATAAPAPPWPWMIATLLLALSTAFTSWRWWRAARLPAPGNAHAMPDDDAREAELFAALQQACAAGDAARVVSLLPRWGRAAFPASGARTASDVARTAEDPALAAEIERLLASRYGTASPPADLDALLARIEAVRRALRSDRRGQAAAGGALPPLYRHG
jgi:hypothetical protein